MGSLKIKKMSFRYSFDKSSKKFVCPSCENKRFVRYIDVETKEYLPSQYGACDRIVKCGYKCNPYTDKYQGARNQSYYVPNKIQSSPTITISNIPDDVLTNTLKDYDVNRFIQNLKHNVKYPFDEGSINEVVGKYLLGTISKGYMAGSVTFPFINIRGKVRAIQVKQFDDNNKTIRANSIPYVIKGLYKEVNINPPTWIEKYNKNKSKFDCLFGEHLLSKYPNNPVALVEAPKSAVYASLYYGFPKDDKGLLWLAVYNLSSLQLAKVRVLKGRDVILFPDLSSTGNAYSEWSEKAKKFEIELEDTTFSVSNFLEDNATEEQRLNGLDIADFLINFDSKAFRSSESFNDVDALPSDSPITKVYQIKPEEPYNPDEWFSCREEQSVEVRCWDISESEDYYNTVKLPSYPIKLGAHTITDVSLFVESHMSIVIRNNGNETYKPYLDRLVQLKKILGEWA